MNLEIGAEAALFPEKEYINGIAVAVRTVRVGDAGRPSQYKSRLPGHSPPAKLDRTPDGVSPLASGLLVCNTQYPGACGH